MECHAFYSNHCLPRRPNALRCRIITPVCSSSDRNRCHQKRAASFMRRTGVTADQIYADPSALSHIYLHQIGSRRMVAWRRRTPGSLPVTHHGRVELINAIGLAVYRGEVTVEKA